MEALVLAAGKGTRMRSETAKVLHEILGRPMLAYVLDTLSKLGISNPKVVLGSQFEEVRSFLKRDWEKAKVVRQSVQRGTGHAVMTAGKVLRRASPTAGDLLIWPGDMPLLQAETLRQFLSYHRRSGAAASVLSALAADPHGYGRILRSGGRFFAVREELDATEAERRIQEVNTGVYVFQTKPLFRALREIQPVNAKGELYLTDTIEVLAKAGERLEAFPLALPADAIGINSREQLAQAVRVVNQREIRKHQERGVTVVSPENTFIEPGVQMGRDTVIHPCCYIESGVKIGRRCQIGPFAKIRKGSVIGDGAVIGSFVEVARSRIGKRVLAKHLAYLGDVSVGDGTNVGAGTITANYDGVRKHRTQIGKNVLIGSNTVLVAPVMLGDRAKTGAGAVVLAGTRIPKGAVVAGVPAKMIRKGHK